MGAAERPVVPGTFSLESAGPAESIWGSQQRLAAAAHFTTGAQFYSRIRQRIFSAFRINN